MALLRDAKVATAKWTHERERVELARRVARESTASNDADAAGALEQLTYAARASRSLRQLCDATGRSDAFWHCLETQRVLFDGWGDTVIPASAPYPSNIGDDHSPYEFSLALQPGRGVEIRLLVEAQGDNPSASSNLAAALALNERLHERCGLSFTRFEAVKDLFITGAGNGFSLWHAVCWTSDDDVEFKIYLNPEARGEAHAADVVREAMVRLGLADQVPALARMTRRGGLDQVKYFSLDLSDAKDSRVKVYAAHRAATARDVEAVFDVAPTHRRGDVVEFCRELVGHTGPFDKRPVQSCLSFTSESPVPTAATFHLPIAHYGRNDAETRARVAGLLARHGLDAEAYERSFDAMAADVPVPVRSTQSYASFKRGSDGIRVTTYLSPRLFGG